MNSVIEVFVDRCVGCHTCEMECALAHAESDTFVDAVYKGEKLHSRMILELDGDDVVPMPCRHCADAPCIAACPTSAMSREGPDEPVVLETSSCIGCKGCVIACPFGVISTIPNTNVLTKCDLCIDKLKAGGIPACVAGCPTGALRFTNVDDIAEERRAEVLDKYRVVWTVSDAVKTQ